MVSPAMPPSNGRSGQSSAPTHSVSGERIVSIEHPCIVRDFDNGMKSLGGEAQIKHVLERKVGDSMIKVGDKTHVYPEPCVGVSLRPNDALAKKLSSTAVETRNILVRVTVPRWTGRKRKRGSDDTFEPASSMEQQQRSSVKAPDLLRHLRDNEDAYRVEALGMIPETHRFRAQPDYQMHTANIPIFRQLKQHVIGNGKPHYDTLKDFTVDLNPWTRPDVPYPLPPSFTAIDQPYRYEYQQGPNVVFTFDADGNPASENKDHAQRRVAEPLAPDAPNVPTGPPPTLKLSGRQDPTVIRAVEDLKQVLAQRPLATKRVFANLLPKYKEDVLKEASQWVGYLFSAGPWRDVLIRFGVDPRSDPAYRFYQTVSFILDKDNAKSKRSITSTATRKTKQGSTTHIFDGVNIPSKIKTWQIADISEPLLHDLLHTSEIRETCDVFGSGWYHAGTLAKARVIMKDVTRCLIAGLELPGEDYEVVRSMPDQRILGDRSKEFNGQGVSQKAADLIREYRQSVRATDGAPYWKSGKREQKESEQSKQRSASQTGEGGGDVSVETGEAAAGRDEDRVCGDVPPQGAGEAGEDVQVPDIDST